MHAPLRVRRAPGRAFGGDLSRDLRRDVSRLAARALRRGRPSGGAEGARHAGGARVHGAGVLSPAAAGLRRLPSGDRKADRKDRTGERAARARGQESRTTILPRPWPVSMARYASATSSSAIVRSMCARSAPWRTSVASRRHIARTFWPAAIGIARWREREPGEARAPAAVATARSVAAGVDVAAGIR